MESRESYSVNGVGLRVYPAPADLVYARDEARLAVQGEDAFAADPDGLVLSRDWELTVGGVPVPVYAAPVTSGGPLSFASLEYAGDYGAITLTARSATALDSAVVRPASLGLAAAVSGQEAAITVDRPVSLIIETNGHTERPLFITVHAPQRDIPHGPAPDLLYYGPGLHEVSTVQLTSGQRIYVAGGAVLRVIVPEGEVPIVERDWAGQPLYRDTFTASGASDLVIEGRGILDLSTLPWHARKAIFLERCERVRIEGLTCVGASHWTIHLAQSQDCLLRDLTLIGYRENSDGIDIVNSHRVTVEDCLIRTGDDAVVVKAMADPSVSGGGEILVRRCTIWNDKVRCLGITGETRSDISGVRFEDCDIVRSVAVWTEELGSLCIVVGDSGTVSDVVFEDIRIEEERRHAMVCLIFKDRFSVDKAGGHIRNIVFRNITLPVGVPSLLHGYDEAHGIVDVMLENITVGGELVTGAAALQLNSNRFVSGIRIRPGSSSEKPLEAL